MNGMMVIVPMNVMIEPMAPTIPSFLFQKPEYRSTQVSHSHPPKNRVAPRTPKAGYIQKISGPFSKKGISVSAAYRCHFVYPKNRNTITIDARIKWYSRSSFRKPDFRKIVTGQLIASLFNSRRNGADSSDVSAQVRNDTIDQEAVPPHRRELRLRSGAARNFDARPHHERHITGDRDQKWNGHRDE